jgi:hypothetical protein
VLSPNPPPARRHGEIHALRFRAPPFFMQRFAPSGEGLLEAHLELVDGSPVSLSLIGRKGRHRFEGSRQHAVLPAKDGDKLGFEAFQAEAGNGFQPR